MNDARLWSVVTVTYNSAKDLREFAPESIPPEVEWVVVDNASTDDSVLVAESLGAKVLRLDGNIGFARANNRALPLVGGEYVLFANPDVRWVPTDLARLASKISASGQDCLVAPQLLESDGSLQPNGRGIPSLIRKVANRANSRTGDYRIFAMSGQQRYIAWAMGAAVAAKRSTFEALGAWNEAFFVYYEDHELGLRAWSRGVPFVLDGDIRWTHGWARETKSLRLRPWLLELHGAIKFFTRYPGLLFSTRFLGRSMRRLHLCVGADVADSVTRV